MTNEEQIKAVRRPDEGYHELRARLMEEAQTPEEAEAIFERYPLLPPASETARAS